MTIIAAADISAGVKGAAENLSARLATKFMSALSPTLKAIATDLREGRMVDAVEHLDRLDLDEAIKASETTIRAFSRQTALIGAGAVGTPSDSMFAATGEWPWEIDKGAVRQTQRAIKDAFYRDVVPALRRRVEAAQRFQKADDEIDPDDLATQINRFMRGEIRRVVDVSANVVGTRVSAYGMLHEARVRGVSKYRIDAVLDDRTTDICRHMNGRIFEVEQAFTRTQGVLQIQEPKTLKERAPFIKPDQIPEFEELSDEDLQARGHDVPPFHFLCRSVVTLIDGPDTPEPEPVPEFPIVDDEDGRFERIMELQEDRLTESLLKQTMGVYNVKAEGVFGLDRRVSSPTENPEQYAARIYSGGDYSDINRVLRKNYQVSERLGTVIRLLDETFEKPAAVAPEPMFVFRGVKPGLAAKFEVGKVFQDDSFMSTSFSYATAQDFASEAGAILEIYIKAGDRIIPLYPVSQHAQEKEMLLPRGTQLRVVGEYMGTFNGVQHRVFKAVIHGRGQTIPADRLGLDDDLPPAQGISKADKRVLRFISGADDMREVAF